MIVDGKLDVASDGGDRNNLGRLAAGVLSCVRVVGLGGDSRGDLCRVRHGDAAASGFEGRTV